LFTLPVYFACPECHYPRDRVFNQWRTFWMFVGQVLSVNQTCREALRKAQVWLCLNNNNDKNNNKKKENVSSNTAAYCKARGRLIQKYLDKVNQEVIEKQQSLVTPDHLWCGRDVKIVDGSSVSMPDTSENQELYPQPSGQKKGCRMWFPGNEDCCDVFVSNRVDVSLS
jgi:hypothetical protein